MSKRVLICFALAALAIFSGFNVAHPVRHASLTSIASSNVAHRIWHLSNPARKFRVIKHVISPKPSHSPAAPSSSPVSTPSNSPSDTAPPSDTATPTDPPSPTDTPPATDTTVPSDSPPASDTPPATDTPPPTDTPSPTDTGGPPNDGTITADYPMPNGDLPDWRMVYSDDFAGNRLNTDDAWSVYNNGPVPSNPDTAYWSPSHVGVQNSMLTINGSQDSRVSPDGRIVTAGLGLWKLPPQTYGKWEMLVRVDQCPQVKYAWLLWPYDGQWPGHGEIDFAEDEGGMRASTVASVLYQGQNGAAATLPQNHLTPSRPMSDWHLVGVEWTPGSVKYTLDGQVWGTVSSNEVPSNPMTFVLQTESKVYPSAIPADFNSCNAQVGWVVQYGMK